MVLSNREFHHLTGTSTEHRWRETARNVIVTLLCCRTITSKIADLLAIWPNVDVSNVTWFLLVKDVASGDNSPAVGAGVGGNSNIRKITGDTMQCCR
jgi:hypothetical protein